MALANSRPNPEGNLRRVHAIERRASARRIADDYRKISTQTNDDENALEDAGYVMRFTKGLDGRWFVTTGASPPSGSVCKSCHYSEFV